VGGIKEKVLAAKRSGVRIMVMPKDNEANVQEDIPAHLREGMTFHFVKTIDEALGHAFEPSLLAPVHTTPARGGRRGTAPEQPPALGALPH
jgi:ATP-dependent Lon protease